MKVRSGPGAGVSRCEVPVGSLLSRCASAGAYTDCYASVLARPVSHQAFVEAFYTTPLFKLERLILRWFAGRPSTDHDARALAQGTAHSFAAWNVAGRTPDELLLADFSGRTRSWLMVSAMSGAEGQSTRLFFGSAVVPKVRASSKQAELGLVFTALLGFHKLYSRALLWSARLKLARQD